MKNIKNVRLKHYDYSSNGYYFVTICANKYKCADKSAATTDTNKYADKSAATTGTNKYADKSAATTNPVNLLRLDSVIKTNIESLYKMSGVKVDYWVIMPDHMHIIIILNHCPMALGEIVRRFKSWIKKEAGFKVWHPNYYEHIIRNEKVLHRIREYIQNNPLAAKIDFDQFYL